MSDQPQFIIWDPKDGQHPPADSDGSIISDGVIGRVGLDNVYLATYGQKPKGTVEYTDLQVGHRVRNVRFSLGDRDGYYDVYRVS